MAWPSHPKLDTLLHVDTGWSAEFDIGEYLASSASACRRSC